MPYLSFNGLGRRAGHLDLHLVVLDRQFIFGETRCLVNKLAVRDIAFTSYPSFLASLTVRLAVIYNERQSARLLNDIHRDDTAFYASSLACPTRFTATSAIDHDDEFGLAQADCSPTRSA